MYGTIMKILIITQQYFELYDNNEFSYSTINFYKQCNKISIIVLIVGL